MRINIENYGTFNISEEALPRLLEFLSNHSAIRIKENTNILERTDQGFTGRELLND